MELDTFVKLTDVKVEFRSWSLSLIIFLKGKEYKLYLINYLNLVIQLFMYKLIKFFPSLQFSYHLRELIYLVT